MGSEVLAWSPRRGPCLSPVVQIDHGVAYQTGSRRSDRANGLRSWDVLKWPYCKHLWHFVPATDTQLSDSREGGDNNKEEKGGEMGLDKENDEGRAPPALWLPWEYR
jgi:hypothetical protein